MIYRNFFFHNYDIFLSFSLLICYKLIHIGRRCILIEFNTKEKDKIYENN